MSITKFESVFSRKIKHNKNKRLEAIENYFLEKHDLEVDFQEDQDNCLAFVMQFIQDDDISEDEVFNEILAILEDRYSIGEPYLIANLQLKEGLEFATLRDILNENINIGTIQQDSFEFTDIQLITDPEGESINITCRYTDYYLNPMTDQREEERPLLSGNLNVKFDYKNRLLITTKSSYNKAVNKMIESINGALWGNAIIKQYYAQHKMRSKALEVEYDPLTLLVINLVFKKLKDAGYDVEGVNSLTFYNNGAPRIKNAKLGGVDLFQDSDIIERICNSDRITSVSIQIYKELPLEEGSVQADLTIDFRGMLKIILNESTSTEHELDEVTYEIFNIINQLVADDRTSAEGTQIFEDALLPNAFKARTFYDFYIDKIELDLKKLLPDKERDIEKYFHSERGKRR
ncbi:hypothetical protein [Oceanobacillus sp. J11TS1]|uniref:hypothetical protein n=1 Tax=Oceanobacillus sp. J11TS1 TaxID=2807191 RepID=UPI001B1C335D|nr:hypothetical protein [Oceanobacillus sp. J11TS1]GIO22248.1 hypothetical protein J11TS1_08290 [Oceanobacillus sp. J11TS1]